MVTIATRGGLDEMKRLQGGGIVAADKERRFGIGGKEVS